MIDQIKDTFSKLILGKDKSKPDAKIIAAYHKSRVNQPHTSICNAPFTNMYFGHEGKVSACCFNRTHLLGSYPEMSLANIWKSEKANELRELLKKDDLSSGCQSCGVLISKKNFEGVVAKNYDTLPLIEGYPTKLEFELTNTCNLECAMCFGEYSSLIRKNREHKPAINSPYDEAFVGQLEEFIPHLTSTRFFGGEPFLIEIYYKIWAKIISINPACQIVIQTNGTVLNKKVRKLLDKGNFKINVSIDSFTKETYESIRVNAKFEGVMDNIKYFNDYCQQKNTNLGVSVCPMTNNWRELPDMIKWCNDMNAFVYFNTVWHPKNLSLGHLPSASLEEISKHLSKYTFPEDNIVQKGNVNHYRDFINLINSWALDASKREVVSKKNEKTELKKQRVLEKKLGNMPAEQLINLFHEKIELAVEQNDLLDKEVKAEKLSEYRQKTGNVFQRFERGLSFKKAIHELNEDPRFENVISVLDQENEDQIYKRIEMMYKEEVKS